MALRLFQSKAVDMMMVMSQNSGEVGIDFAIDVIQCHKMIYGTRGRIE